MTDRQDRASGEFQTGDAVIWFQRLRGRSLRIARSGTVVCTIGHFTILDWSDGHYRCAKRRHTQSIQPGVYVARGEA